MRFEIKKYEIETKEINTTIAHISDIHFSVNYKIKRLEKLKAKLKEQSPNYICITGDLLDEYEVVETKEIEKFTNWIKEISEISKVIISLGNHDFIEKINNKYFEHKKTKWIEDLENNKIKILNNKIYKENKITFIGYNPNHEYYNKYKEKRIEKYNEEISKIIPKEKKSYNILLLHTPNLFTKNYNNIDNLNNIDLILCGHTHGGMIPSWIPGTFGIIGPNKLWFPKKIRGKIKLDKTTLIISSGIVKLSKKSKIEKLNDIYSSNINIIKLKSKI